MKKNMLLILFMCLGFVSELSAKKVTLMEGEYYIQHVTTQHCLEFTAKNRHVLHKKCNEGDKQIWTFQDGKIFHKDYPLFQWGTEMLTGTYTDPALLQYDTVTREISFQDNPKKRLYIVPSIPSLNWETQFIFGFTEFVFVKVGTITKEVIDTASNGQYFYFNLEDMKSVLGRDVVYGEKLFLVNITKDNSVDEVVVWPNSHASKYIENAGHGRKVYDSKAGDWSRGDIYTLLVEPPRKFDRSKPMVCYYTGVRYKGQELCYTKPIISRKHIEYFPRGFDKKFKSLRIANGNIYVRSYEQEYFGGRYYTRDNDDPIFYRQGMFNNISSAIIANKGERFIVRNFDRSKPMVCLYTGVNYSGEEACYTRRGSDNRVTFVGDYWNDRFKSLKVGTGVYIRMFTDTNFRGRYYTRYGDDYLMSGYRDIVSSLIVYKK